MKIDCSPLFLGILVPEGSVLPHAQIVCLPVLWAVRIYHCVQPVLDGPAKAAPAGARSRQRSPALLCSRPCRAGAAAQSYRLCDKGGRVAVYRCGTDGQPEVLITITGIYTNLLPENDALRIKRGVTVYSERELDLLLEDLGE